MLRSSQHFTFDLTTKWHFLRPEPTHLYQSFSSAQRVLSDFPRGVVAPGHLLGRGVLHLPTHVWYYMDLCAGPIRAMDQMTGLEPAGVPAWKAGVLAIRQHLDILLLSCVSYIYIIQEFSRKVKFLEGSPRIELG